ncbi:hypothetical protein LXL04_003848 [Taraxacum kok-saghyz]
MSSFPVAVLQTENNKEVRKPLHSSSSVAGRAVTTVTGGVWQLVRVLVVVNLSGSKESRVNDGWILTLEQQGVIQR